MVGPSGSGKSSAWRVLLKALQRLEGIEGVSYVIDPKAMSKVMKQKIWQNYYHPRNIPVWSILPLIHHRIIFTARLIRIPVSGLTVCSHRYFAGSSTTSAASCPRGIGSCSMATSTQSGLKISTLCLMTTNCWLCPTERDWHCRHAWE